MLNGIAGGSTPRGNLKFAVDRSQVVVDGARTDDQLFGYLGVCQPLRHQPQHLYLTDGQPSGIGGCWPGGWSWRGKYRLALGSKSLLRCHRSSLRPGGGKGLLSESRACGGHCLLIVSAINGRQRGTNVLPQGFCC